jgi:hypothetical protein
MVGQPVDEQGERLSPDEAFAALGNETRVHILQSLWEADGLLGYSELKERVGVRNSGRFNYHLDRLTDHFIKKADGGYELRMAGEQVVGALLSGSLTSDPTFGPVELNGTCPHCGQSVQADYADETLTVWCTGEEGHIPTDSRAGALATVEFPPAGLTGRTPDEMAQAAIAWANSHLTPMYEGVCPRCAGPVSLSLQVCEDHDGGRGRVCEQCDAIFAVWAERICEVCRFEFLVPAWHHLLGHPTVAGFYYQRGVTTTPWTWEMLTAEVVRPTEELTEDPFRLQFTFDVDGDELVVTLDEELAITDVAEGSG